MNPDSIFEAIKNVINNKKTLAICLPSQVSLDSTAAATSLYLGLAKLGKSASIGSSSLDASQFSLIAVDKIQPTLSSDGNNLVISFPYTEGAVDKVTHYIEGNVSNIVIHPASGFERLDSSQVKFHYAGGKVDAFIVFDCVALDSLGELYSANTDSFKDAEIINIDRHLTNANFGTINYISADSASYCEMIYRLLQALEIEIDADIATNLYSGIIAATKNFTAFAVSPETFEICAALLKKGAVKKAGTPVAPKPAQEKKVDINANSSPEAITPAEAAATPIESVENKEIEEAGQPRPEWLLKPKIFKGTGLV